MQSLIRKRWRKRKAWWVRTLDLQYRHCRGLRTDWYTIAHQEEVAQKQGLAGPNHCSSESRRDQEEEGELDSHEEVRHFLWVQAKSRGGR